ncbi:MAG: hypothetical protein Q7J16_08190 [Candidatus Cloacimonadales bacterium]|nr:hypothetical protein [Candidatus Cloacimonadales bacterium]
MALRTRSEGWECVNGFSAGAKKVAFQRLPSHQATPSRSRSIGTRKLNTFS